MGCAAMMMLGSSTLAGEDEPLEIAAGEQPRLRVDARRRHLVFRLEFLGPSRATPVLFTSQPRAMGARR